MRVAQAAIVILAIALAGGLGMRGTAVAALVSYFALTVLLVGICWRVVLWARAPVPFRIPTTCGQQKSLSWLDRSRLDNPASGLAAVGRMALEVLAFRSLSRNNRAQIDQGRIRWSESNVFWLAALAFHWSLLMIVLRHVRLFLEPVPGFVLWLERADGFLQLGTPKVYISDFVFSFALAFLLWRRLSEPTLRYISLFSDYLAVFLLSAIGISGLILRYWVRTDIVAVKQFGLGLATFHPQALPAGFMFPLHLAMICALAAYLPFSKLMHFGGIFLSPTRNLANNNRSRRHVNPWDYPVKTHTYAEWEEDFHDKLVAAGMPVEAPHGRTTAAH